MKRIQSRNAEKKWRHRFSHYKPIDGDFFRRSRAANSAVGGPIRPKFKLVRALLHAIIACKYEKDRIITLWALSVAMEIRVLIRSIPMMLQQVWEISETYDKNYRVDER